MEDKKNVKELVAGTVLSIGFAWISGYFIGKSHEMNKESKRIALDIATMNKQTEDLLKIFPESVVVVKKF